MVNKYTYVHILILLLVNLVVPMDLDVKMKACVVASAFLIVSISSCCRIPLILFFTANETFNTNKQTNKP